MLLRDKCLLQERFVCIYLLVLFLAGTLLLQIGEVGRRFVAKRENSSDSASIDSCVSSADCTPTSKMGCDSLQLDAVSPCSSTSMTSDSTESAWSITFEQFLANVTTESPLVAFFEKKMDLVGAIEKLRSRRLIRQPSVTIAPTSPSPSSSVNSGNKL